MGILDRVVPDEIVKALKGQIENYDFKELLDNKSLLQNAGEGIADEIAFRVLSVSESERAGLNRFHQDVWRMVYVTNNQCRIFRKPKK